MIFSTSFWAGQNVGARGADAQQGPLQQGLGCHASCCRASRPHAGTARDAEADGVGPGGYAEAVAAADVGEEARPCPRGRRRLRVLLDEFRGSYGHGPLHAGW